MPTRPDQASFYPDVPAEGNLAAVLQATADADGFSLPILGSESTDLYRAAVVSKVPHRKKLIVSAYTWKRWWSIRGVESFRDMELSGGDSDELTQIVRAARAWHEGAGLAEIRAAAPFVHLSGRFEVPDNDPAQVVESEWQHLRTRAAEADWPDFQALVEAAFREPALRVLYPSPAAGRCGTPPPRAREWTISGCSWTHIAEAADTLSSNLLEGEILSEAVTAEELASEAVRHLPPA